MEQAHLQELIKWMSIEQTAMLACIVSVTLAAVLLCFYKFWRSHYIGQREGAALPGYEGSTAGQDSLSQLINSHGSPVNFRKLASLNGKLDEKEVQVGSTTKGSPASTRDYLYSDDTPSFHH